MATQWFWKDGETPSGPLSFQELASLIRDHILNEDDLVRPHYSNEWQTTDTVVGLFYMAQRVPVPRPEVAATESEINPSAIAAGFLEGENFGRSYTLDEVGHELVTGRAFGEPNEHISNDTFERMFASCDVIDQGGESAECQSDSQMSDAIAAAADDWDRRHVSVVDDNPVDPSQTMGLIAWLISLPRRLIAGLLSILWGAAKPFAKILGWGLRTIVRSLRIRALCRLLERVASRQTLSWWFRSGCTLAAGGIVAYVIVSWSDYEDLRFPDAKRIETGERVFPMLGPCEPLEYALMLMNVVLLSGFLGYFGSRWLESLAED